MNATTAIQFIGGLFVFLFGMNYVKGRLERASGDKLRSMINYFVRDRYRSFITGIASTFIMESSGAATVMFVGFASVGILTLYQSIALTAGATVGTTLFVMILAHFIKYKLINFSFYLIIGGFLVGALKKKGTLKYIADALVGFGLIFLGVYFMIESFQQMGGNAFFTERIREFASNPLQGIAIAALFTAIIHSSAGTIGIALSLTALNVISLESALPIVIGANIGTCFTAILASINTTVDGKRVAWSHLFMKLLGAIILFPFLSYFADFVEFLTINVNYQVALSHFIFNLFNSALVMIGLKFFVDLVRTTIPDEKEEKGVFKIKFLDTQALDNPQIAFGNVVREILRMADICQEMLKLSIEAIGNNDKQLLDTIIEMDDKVDLLNDEIKFYLAKISQEELTSKQAGREMDLLSISNNFELIGDLISKTIKELAEEKIKMGAEFSKEGWKDIKEFHSIVHENFHLAVTSFASGNIELARRAMDGKKTVRDLEEKHKKAHFLRLSEGLKESHVTSSIHLELLGHYRRVNSYVVRVGQVVLGKGYYGKEVKREKNR